MHLLENPFHILGASPRDDRRRILELAEERSLSLDPAVCAQARAALTNPRNRLAVEVAWLPGVAPRDASEALDMMQRTPLALRLAQGLPALAKANLLSAALLRGEGVSAGSELVDCILELAALSEACSAEEVRALVNEERAVAGFPEVRETSVVEEALAEQRGQYLAALKHVLNGLLPLDLVVLVTRVVMDATERGTRHAPALIDDLVNTYEVEAQRFLDAEAGNVEQLIAAVRRGVERKRAPHIIECVLSRLVDVVENWDMVAQPIQLSAMSRGLDHELSHRVASQVRSLAVDLYNQHKMLEESKRLTALLRNTFAEVPRVAEVVAEDTQALEELARQRAAEEQWARAISFEAAVGTYQRRPLKISKAGIDWNGVRWPLDSITAIRWGGVTKENGSLPVFQITFSIGESHANVATYDRNVFATLREKLWIAVGRRLLFEMLAKLDKAGRFRFGDAIIDDSGVELPMRRYRGDTMRLRGTWSQIHIDCVNGCLLLKHMRDPSAYAVLPYLSVDNVPVLENAIRNLLATKSPVRMSDLLRN